MSRLFCVHGHFYQPPRESPWTGELDPEESARPHRDWNERVHEECYGPNAAAPFYDDRGLARELVDNYRLMSFNVGPTLASWLERRRPETYAAILEADRASADERGGHGNAIAQPYYHAILPLQSLADKRTLVRWGIADFKARFGRDPEGMWLPETAVDSETLEILVEEGLRFTILAPHQAAAVRDVGAVEWRKVSEKTLQPTRPYRWTSRRDPSRHISVFFYHRGLARAVVTGEAFAEPNALLRLVLARYLPGESTQLVSLANDGEFYGHHHKAGAAALAALLRQLPACGVELVNYAQLLDRFPPPQEVEIRPRTAWSCEHGLGRWEDDCGCRSPRLPDWRQNWRRPLREALDWLASRCDGLYLDQGAALLRDPAGARDRYITHLAAPDPNASPNGAGDRSLPLAEAAAAWDGPRRRLATWLLEMQRHRLAMYTSCGWFFDDVSGLEAALCLQHAARAVELGREFGADWELEFRQRLARAPSNLKRYRNAAVVYDKLVLPRRVDLRRAAAHCALAAHLEAPGAVPSGGLSAEKLQGGRRERRGKAGKDRTLSWLRLRVRRDATLEELEALGVVHQRDRLDLACWILEGPPDPDLPAKVESLFAELGPHELDAALGRLAGTGPLGLDALLGEEKLNALRLLLPGPSRGRQQTEFLAAWARAAAGLRNGLGEGEAVLDLLPRCRELKLKADRLPWIAEVRAALGGVLDELSRRADAGALSRAARWLEACEDAELGLPLWEMRRLYWRWRARLLRAGGTAGEREAALALGERLGFADAALPPASVETLGAEEAAA